MPGAGLAKGLRTLYRQAMSYLVPVGSALTLIGLFGILWTVLLVRRAKVQALDDDDLKQRISRVLPINLAAFLTSALGLMAVLMGVILG